MPARPDPVLVRRCSAQLLSGPPAASIDDAVRHLLAVQGQDPRGFRLALRTRTAGTTAAQVEEALTERRSLVVSWLHRGTLHLVAAEDHCWLHALTTPQLASASALRLRQEGVTPELAARGIDVVVGEIRQHGPRTRDELRTALVAADVPVQGQALVHVLLAATLAHRVVRGPVRDGEHRMVLADEWLGAPVEDLDRPALLVRLAGRYLAAHGPASPRDLAYWAGLPLRDARAGFAGLRERTAPVAGVPGRDGAVDDDLVDLTDRPEPGPPPTRLLGNFDPVLHGWRSRWPVLGDHDPQVVLGGVFRAFALVEGRAAGLWRIDAGRVRIAPFGPLDPRTERALLRDAADVRRFLDLPDRDPVVDAPA